MRFPDRFLEELRDRCRLEDIVAQYVTLKNAGSNQLGLCPFHREKTPSFTVSPDKQIFHCFGCGEGGNVFSFVMKIEHMDFPEAIALLAQKAGMALPEGDDDEFVRRRAQIYDMNREAARYFHATLKSEQGKEALSYLRQRGLSDATITRFGLGFAPDQWDGLLTHLQHLGYDRQAVADAGLAVKNQKGGVYDRFRNRVIFPIIDLRSQVIGFGGRVMDSSLPKYLNSPDTPAFNKSRNLFALHKARQAANGRLLLAEGYMDVIALHQAGFQNAVASLGTSLTPEQARLMARYAKEVVICYDADAAGQTASNRAIGILKEVGLSVRVLSIPGAKDPDEYIRTHGADRFAKLLDGSANDLDYRFSAIAARYDLKDLNQKVEFLSQIVTLLAGIPSAVERELYLQRTAKEHEIPTEALRVEVEKRRKALAQTARKQLRREEGALLRPHRALEQSTVLSRALRAEQNLLSLLLFDPDRCTQAAQQVTVDDFSDPLHQKLYDFILQQASQGLSLDTALFHNYFEPQEFSYVTSLLAAPPPVGAFSEQLTALCDILRREKLKKDALSADDTQENRNEMIEWYRQMKEKKQ